MANPHVDQGTEGKGKTGKAWQQLSSLWRRTEGRIETGTIIRDAGVVVVVYVLLGVDVRVLR